MSKILTVSPSPHIHSGNSVSRLMYDVLLALMPAFLVSLWFFGVGALYVTVVSVLACLLTEYLITKYMLHREPTLCDGSALVTGVLLAFNVPTNLPIWIIIIGAVVAVGVGKMTFGGLGNNPFNPALVGRVFLLISFPVQMTSWPRPIISRWNLGTVFNFGKYPADYVDVYTGATPLGAIKESANAASGASASPLADSLAGGPSWWDILIGNMGGSMGEVAAIALLLGFVWLLCRRVITWHIPVSVIATAFVFTAIIGAIHPEWYANPYNSRLTSGALFGCYHILTGGLLLGAIFMATDYVTSPMTPLGMIIYGIGIGAITIIIREYGAYPEGMSFAILIMNAFVPLLNTYIKPKRFGKELKIKS